MHKLDGSVPVKYGLRLNMDEKYRTLKREVSQLSNIPEQELLIVEVNGPIVKVSALYFEKYNYDPVVTDMVHRFKFIQVLNCF